MSRRKSTRALCKALQSEAKRERITGTGKKLDAVKNANTRKSYDNGIKQFTAYLKASGIREYNQIKDMDAGARQVLIADYVKHLNRQRYTSATIHTKLAPVCRALGVAMQEIKKPIRRQGDIVRSIDADFNQQGKAELNSPKYARLVEFQKTVGIRRSELRHLRGCDCIRRGKALYVIVRRGKGGKEQWQWIAPKDQALVESYFDGTDGFVFSREEIPPHADLHSLRAQHAKEMYHYFAGFLARHPESREKFERAVIAYAKAHGSESNVQAVKAGLRSPKGSTEIVLRGESIEIARDAGMPTTLDRTAVMLVSVMCLAHWRANVTVTNYLLKP